MRNPLFKQKDPGVLKTPGSFILTPGSYFLVKLPPLPSLH